MALDPRKRGGGAPEVKRISVDPRSPNGLMWRAERWDNRYLFIGPEPGSIMFHSCEATDWSAALAEARMRWIEMERAKRDRWYGQSGVYATNFPVKAA